MNPPEGWPTQEMIDAWKLDQAQGRSLESSCLAMLKVGYERLSENHAFVVTTASLQNIPEGWKLVPVEPTEEMIKRGAVWAKYAEDAYNAMLAAAPTPPAQENENRLCPECGAECMHVSIPNSYWHKCKKCSWGSSPAQEDEPVSWKVCDFCDDSIPVYTRPDDKLRKAAEELLQWYDRKASGSSSDVEILMQNLRAALEGK